MTACAAKFCSSVICLSENGRTVVAKLNADGSVKSIQPFITGFLQDNKYIGRPVDVELMKDGSMLISDDWNGAVYRLTYGLQRVSARH